MRRPRQRAFTLIELLCVSCIILILASLMLGPVFKAFKRVKRLEGEWTGTELVERFRDRMEKHLGAAKEYPARSVQEMYAAGLIDYQLRDFFKRKEVRFIPFSSSTPDTAPILLVEVSPGQIMTLLKADIKPKD
jgi:prepilin-type N-terminal cleavage/methylation domain-containing protein